MDVFAAPEKRPDGSYCLRFSKPVVFAVELTWNKGAAFPTPDLAIQSMINEFRQKTLKDLLRNKAIFKSPPTLASLTAITPMWGILLRGETMTWSQQDIWAKDSVLETQNSVVVLEAQGVVLSRQSILPMWGVQVRKVIPDSHIIDLDFEGGSAIEDAVSVHSDELTSEEGVVALKDPEERKKQMKAYVRDLLEKVAQAKMEADDAMDRFFSEFDLSENESDFSEYEDD